MGFWLDDQRHGSAVVLTQYGVYFEGSFKENKMSVSAAVSRLKRITVICFNVKYKLETV